MKRDLKQEVDDLRNSQEMLIKVVMNQDKEMVEIREMMKPMLLDYHWRMKNLKQEINNYGYVKRR